MLHTALGTTTLRRFVVGKWDYIDAGACALPPPHSRLKYILFGYHTFIQCINLQLLIVKSYNKSVKRSGVVLPIGVYLNTSIFSVRHLDHIHIL